MDVLQIALQVVIALGIVNVWLFRPGKATAWRGGNAKTMREEFAAYSLPGWFMMLIGILKIALAAMLVVGIWFPQLTVTAP